MLNNEEEEQPYYDLTSQGFNRHTSHVQAEKTLIGDLYQFNLPKEIIQEAESIFQKLRNESGIKIRKGKKKMQLLFYCIYFAYFNTGYPPDHKNIAELIGITQAEGTKSLSAFGENASIVYASHDVYIREYIEIPELNLDSESKEEIIRLSDRLLGVRSEVLENFPHVLAAAIIQLYLTNKGRTTCKSLLANRVGRSEMTIAKIVKQLKKLILSLD